MVAQLQQEPSPAPPEDIQAVIDKTIPIVLDGGNVVIDRLLTSKPDVFSFLETSDPYHQWYQWRLASKSLAKTGAGAGPSAGDQAKGPEIDPESQSNDAIEQAEVPSAPTDLLFSAPQPSLSFQDLEVVKLTSYYVSKSKEMLPWLEKVKKNDPIFAFLKKSNSLHAYFRYLVDQYSLVFASSEPMLKRVAAVVNDKHKLPLDVLQRSYERAEYLAFTQKQLRDTDMQEERKRRAFAAIDWQDFEVVANVEITADDYENTDIRPPLDRETVEFAPIAEKGSMLKLGAPTKRKERMLKSPYTNEMIPESQFEEHIRIMNLDPRWKKQKQVADERKANSSLDTDHALENLKRFNNSVQNRVPKKARKT